MGSLGVSRTGWPVVAWIRLRLRERPTPLSLVAGVAPPVVPPLDILETNPVPTDPRKRVFAYEEEHGSWVLRLVWDADEPELLEAEFRSPRYGVRPSSEEVRAFWGEVRRLTAPIGPLAVDGADPRP